MVTHYLARCLSMLLGLSHDIWLPPAWSVASTCVPALGTTSAKTLRVIPVRVICFQIASSVIDDGIDGHDLYLARVVEGHYFGKVLCFGLVFEHHRD